LAAASYSAMLIGAGALGASLGLALVVPFL